MFQVSFKKLFNEDISSILCNFDYCRFRNKKHFKCLWIIIYTNRSSPCIFAVLYYNMSLDVNRKAESPSRFYFSSDGTPDVVTGSMQVSSTKVSCKTHEAFMRVMETSFY